MQIESVHAHAFGPFSKQMLALAPGLNLIYGPNEAGKSSWHAALYAGLCGMPRGRGRLRKEDQDFRDHHHPWDGAGWQVGVTVRLADGRRVELRHDLVGKVDCSALDADLGRDYSSEIMRDGAPDGACWLGLDRRSFLAIACVRQADLLGVLDRPDLLREYLQRAADSLSQDASVALAIARLDDYRRDYVGRDAGNAVKPLRRAREQQERARDALIAAQRARQDYQALVGETEALSADAREADCRLALVKAKRAMEQAEVSRQRLERARALAAQVPGSRSVSGTSGSQLADQVTAALHDWETRADPPMLTGESAAELREQLQALPQMPAGDFEPHQDVLAAARAHDAATQKLEYHQSQRPTTPPCPTMAAVGAAELRQLAGVLAQPRPAITPAIEARFAQAKAQDTATVDAKRSPLHLILAGTLAIVGLVSALAGVSAVGLILIVIAGALGLWSVLRMGTTKRTHAEDELRDAELALRKAQLPMEEYERRCAEALLRLRTLGLPPDSAALERLARQIEEMEQADRALRRWTETGSSLQQQVHTAQTGLAAALRSRGVALDGDIGATYDAYARSCAERRKIAVAAARRADLERRLADRITAETVAAQAHDRRERAEAQLRSVAPAAGMSGDAPDTLVAGLRAWQGHRQEALQANEQAQRGWAELQTLLDGATLEELAARTRQHDEAAHRLAEGLPPQALATVQLEPDLQAQEAALAQQAQAKRAALDRAMGQLEERQRTLRPVPDAEEELASAAAEFDRVRRLDETLETTRVFLERAQQNVHRSVAPVLAGAVRCRLPSITAGHYTNARVDPENLDVQVLASDGQWRRAALLSHGTAEQIYLLLRVALAQYLTRPGEICPLILDDVTVHCDQGRKRAVLETLRDVSQARQVILFSQEREVLEWAEAQLQAPRDSITHLAPLGAGRFERTA